MRPNTHRSITLIVTCRYTYVRATDRDHYKGPQCTLTPDASIYYLNVNRMKTCIAQQLGVNLKQDAHVTARVVIRIECRNV
jgi:hypothetical protein